MTTTTSTKDPIATARAAVFEQRQVRTTWQAKKANAEAELEQLRECGGEFVLDNPDAMADVPAQIATLSAQIELAEQALVAVEPRIARAEAAYLSAEADRLDAVAAAAEAAARAHHAKITKLLDQLEALDGVGYVSAYARDRQVESAVESAHVYVEHGRRVITLPISVQLDMAAALARRQVEAVRALARGDDPRSALWPDDDLPECLTGPSALVPAPQYRAAVERARDLVAELVDLLESVPHDLERDLDEARRLALGEGAIEARRARHEHRMSELPAEIEKARADLAALTGEAS